MTWKKFVIAFSVSVQLGLLAIAIVLVGGAWVVSKAASCVIPIIWFMLHLFLLPFRVPWDW
jgi:hypothetical protein